MDSASQTSQLHGHCLCSAIQVQIALLEGAGAGELLMCHCSQCRKAAGAPFLSVFPVARARVEIEDPQRVLREYRASATKVRAFCGVCGAPIYSQRDGAPDLRLRAGLFDQLGPVTAGGHIHMDSAAAWYRERDQLPRYAELEPGREPISRGAADA